jgi:hypothetical protein
MVSAARSCHHRDKHHGRSESSHDQRSTATAALRAASRRGRLGADASVRRPSSERSGRHRVTQCCNRRNVMFICIRDCWFIRYQDRPSTNSCVAERRRGIGVSKSNSDNGYRFAQDSLIAGTLYALDKHERHRLKVTRRMRVICTFVPPLVGGEIHDVEGSYDAG